MARLLALVLGTVASALLAEGGLALHAALVHDGATDRGGLSGRLTDHHERLGWLGRAGANVRHHTTEFDVSYRIDARGLRELPEDVVRRRPGRERLTVLGDSFVFGQGVAEDQRLSVLLSRRFDCEVIELALPGTGTGQQLLLYEELAGRHRGADVVVLGYLPEHIERTVARRRAGRSKPFFVLDAAGLRLEGVPVPDDHRSPDERAALHDPGLTLPGKLWLQRHSRLYALLREHLREPLLRLLGKDAADPHPGLARGTSARSLTTSLLKRLADDMVADGGRLLVAFVPEPWHLRHADRREHQEAVAQMSAEAGADFVDLTGQLSASQATGGPAYHARDGHWTAQGQRLAAEALGDALLALGWTDPPR